MKTLPPKTFSKGPKRLIAWRLPEALLSQIDKIADRDGWTVSDIAATALDQYVRTRLSQPKDKRKRP